MKFFLTISGKYISSRLDMTSEIFIAETHDGKLLKKPKNILLNKTTATDMCDLILREDTECLICGGIEERYYKYLRWKKTKVIESVIAPHSKALELAMANKLKPGMILYP